MTEPNWIRLDYKYKSRGLRRKFLLRKEKVWCLILRLGPDQWEGRYSRIKASGTPIGGFVYGLDRKEIFRRLRFEITIEGNPEARAMHNRMRGEKNVAWCASFINETVEQLK